MANVNAPFGLRPVRSLSAADTQVNEYVSAAAYGVAIYIGDPLLTVGTSTSANAPYPDGTPLVQVTSTITTTAMVGAAVGVRPTLTNLTLQYRPASTLQGVLVADAPYQIFQIQSIGTMLSTDVGATAGITTGTGSTYTGLSAYTMTETGAGTSSYVLKVRRLAPIANNLLGASSIAEVTINLHENGSTAAGT